MDLKEFTYGILMLIIPLILIILIFRVYISRKCHNNKECMKKNLLVSMDEVSNKLKLNVDFIKNNMKPEEPQVVEGFFGGLTDWFLGSTDCWPALAGINRRASCIIEPLELVLSRRRLANTISRWTGGTMPQNGQHQHNHGHGASRCTEPTPKFVRTVKVCRPLWCACKRA